MSSEYPSTTIKARNLFYEALNKKEMEEFVRFLRSQGAEELSISRRKLHVSFGRMPEKEKETP